MHMTNVLSSANKPIIRSSFLYNSFFFFSRVWEKVTTLRMEEEWQLFFSIIIFLFSVEEGFYNIRIIYVG